MSRINRFIERLISRSFDYRGLESANTVEESVAWFNKRPVYMFNGNVLRAKVAQGIVDTNRCSLFVETGTYHATTTIGAHRFLHLPVWSCDVDPKNYRLSRLMTLGISGISLINRDSRDFIRDFIEGLKAVPDARPLYFIWTHMKIAQEI